MMKRSTRLRSSAGAGLLATLATVVLAVGLTGCPDEGVVCSEGLTACGNRTCEDLTSDRRNCGACGVACQVGQICQNSACICAPGATDCNGACVVTQSDPRHCGGCAVACAQGEVCESGMCQTTCSLGSTRCGDSCVNTETDAFNCGGCGTTCEQGQSCHGGVCAYDLVAACLTNGQVRGLQAGTSVQGPLKALGSGPQSLALYAQEVLLSADTFDNSVYQASITTLDALPRTTGVGQIPNHIVVAEPWVYVLNSGSGTLAVLRGTEPSDGGTDGDGGISIEDGGEDTDGGLNPDGGMLADAGGDLDGGTSFEDGGMSDAGFWAGGDWLNGHLQFESGVALDVVAELSFGENTYPQVMTRVGSRLYVTLYGGTTPETAGAGQKVAEVDISNPLQPTLVRTIDLTTLDLPTFAEGGQSLPRPQGITERGGTLYVALNNFGATSVDLYSVAGPGAVATVPLDGGSPGLITLPQETCVNAVWAAPVGTGVLVSCAGNTDFSMFPVVRTTASGVAFIGGNDEVLSSVALGCGGADAGCVDPSMGRFGVVGTSAYVGDQAQGRVFVVDVQDGQVTETATYGAGQPLLVCPVGMAGYSNVSDVLSVP